MGERGPRQPADPEGERARLIGRGVPEVYVEEIIGRRNSWTSDSSGLAFMPVFCGVLALAWFAMKATVEDGMRFAAAGAAKEQAWVYQFDPGQVAAAAHIGLIFGAIVSTGWLWSVMMQRVKPFPEPNATASVLRDAGFGQGALIAEWFIRRTVRRAVKDAKDADAFLLPEGDADAFLLAMARRQGNDWRLLTLVLGLPCLAVAAATHWNYWTAGPVGITLHSPWSTKQLAWTEAESLDLGCNSTRNSEDLIYDVSIGGRSYDLIQDSWLGFDDTALQSSQIITQLEKLDAALPPIPRKRWSWLNRDPMHPDCLAYWEFAGGKNGPARIAHLMRVP